MSNTTELAKMILEQNEGLEILVSDANFFTLEDVAAFAKDKNLGWDKEHEYVFGSVVAKKYAIDNHLVSRSSSRLYIFSLSFGEQNERKVLYFIPNKVDELTEEQHKKLCLDLYYKFQAETRNIPSLSELHSLESSASIMSSAWKHVDELENGPVVRGRCTDDDGD